MKFHVLCSPSLACQVPLVRGLAPIPLAAVSLALEDSDGCGNRRAVA